MSELIKYTEIMKQLNYKPIGSVLLRLSGVVSTSKCYHYDHEWKSDGSGGLLKYCNDCKCYV